MNLFVTTLSDRTLSSTFCQALKVPLLPTTYEAFADSQVQVTVHKDKSVFGSSIVIVQTIAGSLNELWMGIILLCAQLRLKGVQRIMLVAPYCGYSRTSYALKALMQAAGIDTLIIGHSHYRQMTHEFSEPLISIDLISVIAQQIRAKFSDMSQLCLVAPDQGARADIKALSDALGIHDCIYFQKERIGRAVHMRECETLSTKKIALICDDIIDTGSTALETARVLKGQGVEHVFGYFLHPVFSAKPHLDIFSEVYVGSTIPLPQTYPQNVIQFDSMSFFITQAIDHITGTEL